MTREERIEKLERQYPGMVDLLGTMYDGEIAEKYDLETWSVAYQRNQLGIERHRGASERGTEERRAQYEERFPGLFDRLGKETDRVLAEYYGVTPQYFCQVRKEFGIEAFQARSPSAPPQPENEVFDWLCEQVGTDDEVADALGISDRRVRALRRGGAGDTPSLHHFQALAPRASLEVVLRRGKVILQPIQGRAAVNDDRVRVMQAEKL